MKIRMKRYGAMIYDKDGEEDGRELIGYDEVEVPEKILRNVIVDIFGDTYEVSESLALSIIDTFNLWDDCEEEFEDEIEERILENYDIDELGKKTFIAGGEFNFIGYPKSSENGKFVIENSKNIKVEKIKVKEDGTIETTLENLK